MYDSSDRAEACRSACVARGRGTPAWKSAAAAPCLPISGPWLFRDVTPFLQLAGVLRLSTRAFPALATRTIRTAGKDGTGPNCAEEMRTP